jgi:hypothetical protein
VEHRCVSLAVLPSHVVMIASPEQVNFQAQSS